MKPTLQLLVFLFTWSCFSQPIYIPDDNFKQLLLASTTSLSVARTASGAHIKVDLNDDGEIDVSEVADIHSLFLINRGIASLTGITAFVNLNDLRCSYNLLSTLDVSGLSQLQMLDCGYNDLTEVNIAGTVLRQFNCDSNSLTSLDYSHLQNVLHLKIDYNDLGPSLNLSSDVLPVINTLTCQGNSFTTINITNSSLNTLYCDDNLLTALVTSGMPSLNLLGCSLNQITSLDISSNSLQQLGCNNNQLTTLELNSQYNLNNVYCAFNPLQSIYIKNGRNENLHIGSGMTTLQYICADEMQLSAIQTTLNNSGNVSVQLDASCDLSAADFANNDDLVIYPNPTESFLHITSTNSVIEVFEAYNMLGQLIFRKTCPCENVDVNFLQPAVYNVVIRTNSGITTRKFIKL